MKTFQISEICKIHGGIPAPKSAEAFTKEGIPFVRMRDLGRYHLTTNLNKTDDVLSSIFVKNNSLKIAPKNSILLPRSGSVALNHRAILAQDSVIVSHICALQLISDEINYRFLYYALCAIDMRSIAKKTTGLDAITFKDLGKIKINVPNLQSQLQLVATLDKAQELIDKRQESNEQLDELLRSTFLEMFGDPVFNPKKWETNILSNLGEFKNGLNYSQNESGNQVLCLGVGDFKAKSKITESDSLSTINLSRLPNESYFLEKGDLVFVRSNGNKELIGRCVEIFPGELKITYSGFCIRLRVTTNKVLSTYLNHLFRDSSFKKMMLKGGRGANISNISQKSLGRLEIPVPPINQQQNFVDFIVQFDELKNKFENSLEYINNLFQSLLQRAFHGDLLVDTDLQLDTFLETEDHESIAKDDVLIQKLIDRFNSNNDTKNEQDKEEEDFSFESLEVYEKAKEALFYLLKTGKAEQIFDKALNQSTLKVT